MSGEITASLVSFHCVRHDLRNSAFGDLAMFGDQAVGRALLAGRYYPRGFSGMALVVVLQAVEWRLPGR